MKQIEGGICASKGFKAAGIHCGIRKDRSKKDLSLIASETLCSAAGVYTTNKVFGAPITVTKQHMGDGHAQAIIVNSGNANTCNADGVEIAEKMCQAAAAALDLDAENILVASTGVIGQRLDVAPIEAAMPALARALSVTGDGDAAEGIMTTDTVKKEVALEFELGGKTCHLGGIAKGSGMIHPNMATMLVFITTDVCICPAMLQKALARDVKNTFNMLSVDGDTSTNDSVMVLANGMAGNEEILEEGEDFNIFMKALNTANVYLSKRIAGDGEGATKLLECIVTGAKSEEDAKITAKSVICSSLVKAAMFGADANWGRILCAIGYSGADVDVSKIRVSFQSEAGSILVCDKGAGVDFSEEKAKEILLKEQIDILVELSDGKEQATAWGCDLTYDYVKINGDYRT